MAIIEDHIGFILKVVANIENKRIEEAPNNHLALLYAEAWNEALTAAQNELRREL